MARALPYVRQASLLVTVLASGLMARQQVLSLRFSHNTFLVTTLHHLAFVFLNSNSESLLRKALTEEVIGRESARARVPPLFF